MVCDAPRSSKSQENNPFHRSVWEGFIYKALPHDAMKWAFFLRFLASRSIPEHPRTSQVSHQNLQQSCQPATHDGTFQHSPVIFMAAMCSIVACGRAHTERWPLQNLTGLWLFSWDGCLRTSLLLIEYYQF